MKRSQAFPSKYMSKEDVQPPISATIDSVVHETLKGRDGEPDEVKPIVYFQEDAAKPLVLNNVNWMSIEDLHGDESDNWSGKKIELFFDPNVMYGSKRTGGVRVRATATPAVAQFANWREAVDYAAANGVGEQDLKEVFKSRGLAGFSQSRGDSAIVYDAIAKANEEPF